MNYSQIKIETDIRDNIVKKLLQYKDIRLQMVTFVRSLNLKTVASVCPR